MISSNSLQRAQVIAAQLQSHGIHLKTVDASPLDVILEHSVPVTETQYAQESGEVLQGVANSTDLRGALHNEVVEQEVATLAEGLASQMRFAKNVVTPQVNAVFEAVKAVVETAANPEYVVVELEPREIYSSSILSQLVTPYVNHTAEVQLISGFPTKDAVAITECLQTGSANFDSELAGLLASRDSAWLEGVYNKYFVAGTGTLGAGANRALLDEYIVLHVLARNLVDTPPEGLSMSFLQYQERMSGLLAISGFLVNAATESYQALEKNGVLVLDYPAGAASSGQVGGGEIQVYGPVYREFLANGGSVEMVIGSALGERYVYVTDVLSRGEVLQTRARAHTQLVHDKHEHSLGARLKSAIGVEVSKLIGAAEVSALVGNESVEKAQERLTTYLTQFADLDVLKDLYVTIRRILVNSMYPASNAVVWLETMDAIAQKNPDLGVRDVGYYTLVELVTDYQLQQVDYFKL